MVIIRYGREEFVIASQQSILCAKRTDDDDVLYY